MFLIVKIVLLYGCCFLLSKMLCYVADVSYCQDCFVMWLMFLIVKIALLMANVSYYQDCFVIWLMFLSVKIALLYG